MEASRQETVEELHGRQLSEGARQFYRQAYAPARAGCLNMLRRAGCSEEEAEDIFQTSFERVMETVDPIARRFAIPQMVNLMKKSCKNRMIDERRHQGILHRVPLADVGSLSDEASETPVELVESREAVAMGREAVAALSDRDRQVFVQRHQLGLDPDEILENFPGLSRRTYRKIMQRANARVLRAFEQIDSGERCQEMEREHLRRFVSHQASSDEVEAIQAHLKHCRGCQQTLAGLRGYLHDVASSLVLVTAASSSDPHRPARLIAEAADRLASAGQALGEATRAARERVRDQVLRIATSLPGTGGEASAGQVLGISTAKIASACAGGALAAGATCAALGLSPLAVVGLQQDGQASPRVQNRVERIVPEEPRPLPSAVREEPAQTKAPAPEASRSSKAAKPASAASPASEPVLRANDPEAGRKTGQELGLESTGRPPQSSAPSTSASSEESVAPSVGSASSTSAGSTAPAPAPAPSGGGGAPADGGAGLGL